MAFNFAPKCTVWSRNFTGLCHSAVHSSTLGCGQSSLSLAAETGVRYKSTDPLFKQMNKLEFIRNYHSQRKSSQQCKLSRHLARKFMRIETGARHSGIAVVVTVFFFFL